MDRPLGTMRSCLQHRLHQAWKRLEVLELEDAVEGEFEYLVLDPGDEERAANSPVSANWDWLSTFADRTFNESESSVFHYTIEAPAKDWDEVAHSSNIAGLAHLGITRTLFVDFVGDGPLYAYVDVGYDAYRRWREAESAGEYHYRYIRGEYPYTALPEEYEAPYE